MKEIEISFTLLLLPLIATYCYLTYDHLLLLDFNKVFSYKAGFSIFKFYIIPLFIVVRGFFRAYNLDVIAFINFGDYIGVCGIDTAFTSYINAVSGYNAFFAGRFNLFDQMLRGLSGRLRAYRLNV